jgi:hypothetical protein
MDVTKTKNIIRIIGLATLGVVILIFIQQRFLRADFDLPSTTSPSREEKIMINNQEKTVSVTDGTKHSIPLDEIRGGGPPKDGIPSIDNPKFISIGEANEFITDTEPGVAIDINGIQRFYPFQILVFHEIVNDTINGQKILISYCPLCLTAIVFDPVVGGTRVEFGVSGKLWNSNLLMYDRKTDSLWSQALGEAVVGERTGESLKVLASDILQYEKWKTANPNGEVLSRDTGAIRFYGQDPYGNYYTTEGLYFPVSTKDDRLKQKDFVLGIIVNGKPKAYATEAIKRVGRLEEEFAGKTIVVEYDENLDVVRIFTKTELDELIRINPFGSFWFSWVASHPDTELYK